MNVKYVGVVAFALLSVGQSAAAPAKKTVFAVAKVDAKTKKIDGHDYHLVAIRLEPHIWLLGSGLSSPVLLVEGVNDKRALAEGDKERVLEDLGHRVTLLWFRLPDKGEIEIAWGALSDPKENNAELLERLKKAGYTTFKVDVQKIPVLKASNSKELLSAMDELATPAKRK